MGKTAVHTIISGCIFFIALMFVCLKAPTKRLLDENYGRNYDDKEHLNEGADVELQLSGDNDYESQGSYPRGSDVYIVAESASHEDRSLDYDESVGGRSGRSGHSRRSRASRRAPELKTMHSETSSANGDAYSFGRQNSRTGGNQDGRESKSASRFPEDSSREGVADAVDLPPKYPSDSLTKGETTEANFDDRMTAAEIAIRRSEQQRISESRVSKIEKMELSSASQSEDLIEKFVSDLNLSFQQDEAEAEGSSTGLQRSSSALKLGKVYQT